MQPSQHVSRFWALCVCLSLLAYTTGCGGGGSSSDPEPDMSEDTSEDTTSDTGGDSDMGQDLTPEPDTTDEDMDTTDAPEADIVDMEEDTSEDVGHDASPDVAQEDLEEDLVEDMEDADTPEEDMDAGLPEARLAIENLENGAVLEEAAFALSVRYDLQGRDADEVGFVVSANGRKVGELRLTRDAQGTALVEVPVTLQAQADGPRRFTLAVAMIQGEETLAEAPRVSVLLDPQGGALERLRGRSNMDAPQLRYVRGQIREAMVDVTVEGDNPVERTWNFLEEFGDLVGVDNPRETLWIANTSESMDGNTIVEQNVRLRQRHQNIPVKGAGINVHLQGERVVWIRVKQTTQLPNTTVAELMTIGPEEARVRAVEAYPGRNASIQGQPRLFWYDEELATAELDRMPEAAFAPTQLAWAIHVEGSPEDGLSSVWEIMISAETGRTLRRLTSTHTENPSRADLSIFDAGGALRDSIEDNEGYDRVCSEAGCQPGATPTALSMWDFLHTTYRYFDQQQGWQSWDDQDDRLNTFVNVNYENGPNASFSGAKDYMLFHPDLVVQDVTAHEFTHGIIKYTIESIYQNSPGALNESCADLFGGVVDGTRDQDPFSNTRFCQHGTSRNLCAPNRPNRLGINDENDNPEFIDHTDFYCAAPQSSNCEDDFGRVHSNSGIMNVVGALLVGAVANNQHPHSGIVVRPIGPEKFAKLWFNILRHEDLEEDDGLTAMCRAARIRANFYASGNHYGFTPQNACAVRNACAGSGFNSPDQDCDGIADDMDNFQDVDLDSFPTEEDNCPLVYNPIQRDRDGDGIGDVCDPDEDNDEIPNDIDNCPTRPNMMQEDVDNNGRGDVCDDSDGDGVIDSEDNCPQVRNTPREVRGAQLDLDGDGIGDACDPDADGDGFLDDGDGSGSPTDNPCDGPGDTNCDDNCYLFATEDAQPDTDNDGIGDDCDNCLNVPNTDQSNVDGDERGDRCDNDADGDGIPAATLQNIDRCRSGQLTGCNDNCPLVPNGAQYDGDDNGLGIACDLEERAANQQALIDGQTIIYEFEGLQGFEGGETPLQPCEPGTCDSLAVLQPYFQVEVAFDAEVIWQIVNQFGETVDRPHWIDTEVGFVQSFHFQPDSDAYLTAFSPQPWVGTSYFLQPIYLGDRIEGQFEAEITARQLLQRPERPVTCGNDVIEELETCDGEPDMTCQDLSYFEGELACGWDCQLDDSGCTRCRNQSQCFNAFGSSCLANGQCGTCSVDADCPAPFQCETGECRLN